MTDTTRADGKPKGWFSRRHETGAPHTLAVSMYLASRGPEARRQKAGERAAEGRVVKRFVRCGHRSSSADHPCEVSA